MEPNDSLVQPDSAIVLDSSSGISLEEQQEILDSINAMAGGHRLSGESLAKEAAVTGAKKKGFLFPLIVNAGALLLLVLGFFLLFFFHGQDSEDIRAGSADLGLTERKLIQEIRQETNRRLSEKENEINNILSKLSSVDAEYRVLQDSVETLTEAQKERAAYLLAMQEEYQFTLSDLQNEHTKIIEESRRQEAELHARAEERVRDLSGQIEMSQANLGSAMDELRRLTGEQDRASAAGNQMSGLYMTLNNQVKSGSLDEAAKSLETMKLFIDAAYKGSRSLEERKQNQLAAVAALEGALGEAMRAKAEPASVAVPQAAIINTDDSAFEELSVKYAELEAAASVLEKKAADQEKALAVLGTQGSDQSRVIAEYIDEINTLRTANSNQQQTLNRRDSEILNLRAENSAGAQQLSELNNSVAALEGNLRAVNSRASENEAALVEQKRQYDVLAAQRDELQRQNADLRRQMADSLRQALQDLESDQ